MPKHALVGKSIHDLSTPALVLDLDLCQQNLRKMSSFFADRPAQLRPHFKNHKCPELARLQLNAGSVVGMTCAHIGEAEVLVERGFDNILIANQVVGSGKVDRLARMAQRSTLAVAVDDMSQATAISQAATAVGVTVGLLMEIDIGMNRCGVSPGESALPLAEKLVTLNGTELRGIQAYEGHIVYINDREQRDRLTRESIKLAVDTRDLLHRQGVRIGTISGGSSSTYQITGATEGVTEIQAGSYATMDWRYQQLAPEFQIALSLLATVISRRKNLAILDVGVKRLGSEFGVPTIKNVPDVDIPTFGSEEHLVVHSVPSWRVGDTVEVIPSHACTTCNLYPEMFVHQAGRVIDVWPIEGRERYA